MMSSVRFRLSFLDVNATRRSRRRRDCARRAPRGPRMPAVRLSPTPPRHRGDRKAVVPVRVSRGAAVRSRSVASNSSSTRASCVVMLWLARDRAGSPAPGRRSRHELGAGGSRVPRRGGAYAAQRREPEVPASLRRGRPAGTRGGGVEGRVAPEHTAGPAASTTGAAAERLRAEPSRPAPGRPRSQALFTTVDGRKKIKSCPTPASPPPATAMSRPVEPESGPVSPRT
jgi:hypothetical protein